MTCGGLFISQFIFLFFYADHIGYFIDAIGLLQGVKRFSEGQLGGLLSDEYDGRSSVRTCLLHHRVNADPRFAEDPCDLGEYSRVILRDEADEVLAVKVVIEVVRFRFEDEGIAFMRVVRGCVNDIRDDRAARREISCAFAVEHQFADVVADHVDPVKCARNLGERMIVGDKCRVDVRFDLPADVLADRKQFDGQAELLSEPDILLCHAADPFAIDRRIGDALAEGEGREDGEFIGTVESVDVCGGIRFRIA